MESKTPKRIWELDFLRGFAILMMIGDHLLYDFMAFPSWFSNYSQVSNEGIRAFVRFATWYWNSDLRFWGHHVFIILFFGVSGISFTFSRNNIKRGLKFLAFSAVIFAVTRIAEVATGLPVTIFSGVITIFALSTLITFLFRKLWDNDWFLLMSGTAAIILGFFVIGVNPGEVSGLTWSNWYLIILGFQGYGADYFGLFPFLGYLMIGTVVGNQFYRNRVSLLPHWDHPWHRPVTFVGRNSLIVFLTHQLVLVGISLAIAFAAGYRF